MSLAHERGFRVRNPALQHWQTLFEEWILAVERFCRLTPGDAPFWYTERANVGILAGAAWRCGWIALEEFQGDKGNGGLGWRGRLDLWLSSSTGSYLIEAKQGWPYLGDSTGAATAVSALEEAYSDAKNVALTEPALRVGVAFCAPYHQSWRRDRISDSVQRLLVELEGGTSDALAWSFPSATSGLLDRRGQHVYPGVLLLARVVTDEPLAG